MEQTVSVETAAEQATIYKPSRYNLFIPLKRENSVLVYNSVSRALAVWDENDLKVYEDLEVLGDFPEIAENLIKARYVVESDLDETKRIRENYRINRHYRRGLTLTVAPTMACNFACDYCFQGDHSAGGVMCTEVQDKLIAYIEKMANEGIRHLSVAWYGGEPLLAKDVIYSLSDRLIKLCEERKLNYSASIVTNGYYLTREVAEKLKECKIIHTQVTLDGDRAQHDSRRILRGGGSTFDIITDNLIGCVEVEGMSYNIRVNIDKRNADSIEGLLKQMCEKGLNGKKNLMVYFAPVDICSKECLRVADHVMLGEEYGRIETKLIVSGVRKKLTSIPYPGQMRSMCAAVRPNGFVVLPNGDIHKCWNTVADISHRVCTINEMDSLEENPVQQKWLDWSPFELPGCADCLLLPNCTGSCAHNAMSRNESPCNSLKYNLEQKLIMTAIRKETLSWDDVDRSVYEQEGG